MSLSRLLHPPEKTEKSVLAPCLTLFFPLHLVSKNYCVISQKCRVGVVHGLNTQNMCWSDNIWPVTFDNLPLFELTAF